MKKRRSVILVGRTNVGKSTLFNRLSTSVKSMTFDEEGVTRDYIKDVVSWKGTEFELIDSAGLSFKKRKDPILEQMRKSALQLLDDAQVVLFVVDGKSGLLPEDQEISRALHKTGKPVVLAINKIDTKLAQDQQYEFDKLGHRTIVTVSSQHATGINELLDLVVDAVKKVEGKPVQEKPHFKVTLLGKPNVGKSSLMNTLLKHQRSLVTEIAGTTREAVSETITFYHDVIELTDTPGVRRKRVVEEDLEVLMVKSAFRAVRMTDLVLLLVDASEGRLLDQELKLAFYAFDNQKKALLIIFNKHDLVDEQIRADWEHSLSKYTYFLKKVQTMNTSCKTGKNVGKVLPAIQNLWKRYNKQFSTDELTQLFKKALEKTPLYRSGNLLKIVYAKQVKTAPITIALTVNRQEWFGSSQLSFFENTLRDYADFNGVPVKFVLRSRS